MRAAACAEMPFDRASFKGTQRHDRPHCVDASWGECHIPQADSLRVEVDSELEQLLHVAAPLPQLVPTVPQALEDVEGSAYDQTLGSENANTNDGHRLPLPALALSLLSRILP